MTNKVYRSVQGKMVDLGTIMLQNEHVRAVGNMKVNARGDKIDNTNRVVETKTQQIKKQNNAAVTNVSASPIHTSAKKAREAQNTSKVETEVEQPVQVAPEPEPEPVPIAQPAPVESPVVMAPPPPPPVETKKVEEPKVETPPPVVKAQPKPAAPAPEVKKPVPEVNLKNPARPAKSPAAEAPAPAPTGGLAAAIARSREIKQELERSRRQKAQDQGIKKF